MYFNIPVITVVILCVIIGSIVIAKNKTNKKAETMNMAIFTLGATLMTSASESLSDKVLVLIAIVIDKKDVPLVKGGTDYIQLFLGLLLIIIGIIMRQMEKRKLYLLNINGLFHEKKVENYSKDLKMDKFDFKEEEIDIVEPYKLFNKNYDEDVFNCILDIMKNKVECFKNSTKNIKVGYTGITSAPLVMYAGKLLESVTFSEYFEFDKTKKIANSYYKLAKPKKSFIPSFIDKDKALNKNYPKLKFPDISFIDESSEEIVLAVGITQSVKDSQLVQFNTENILKIESETTGDNTIRSINQLDEYSDEIIEFIKELQERFDNLKVIHFTYAGQSCLAMRLGQRLAEKTRMAEIIAYQFKFQGDIKYPWGLVVSGDRTGTLINCTNEGDE